MGRMLSDLVTNAVQEFPPYPQGDEELLLDLPAPEDLDDEP